ncbi:MAG: Crp/Fnr family transcriptional regulator [Bacteroidales bacterium]|nr:Crp/Fnr family transcriptional regulator [Bacteroidales bacterium]
MYHIKKGNKVFSAGQLVEGLFFIYQGKVKITYQRENSEQLIRLASNGEIVGHRGINKNMIYPINAIALEDSTLCFVPMESYLKLTYENKDFGYHMLMFFADELQYSEQTTYELVRKNNTEKTAYALLKFLQAFGANKDGLMGYSPTVHDISAMIYLNVDQVKKALNKLKDHSIIKTDNNEITILKAMQLEKVAV